jgi:hypothetical protein
MLITIDGIPGGNKSALRNDLSRLLSLPNLTADETDHGVIHAARSMDQNEIAIANIVYSTQPHPSEGGVRKWSVAQADAYFWLLFERTSETPAARAYRAASALAWKEDVRVVVALTPEESMEQAPESNLTLRELKELKTAEEAQTATSTARTIVVRGASDKNSAGWIIQQLRTTPNTDQSVFL